MFILEVAAALRKAGVSFAVAGGHAVSLHGAVRGTVDLDLVLRLAQSDYEAAERALKALGLEPRLPVSAAEVFAFRKEYIEKRNLAAWSFCDPKDPTRLVDIIITHDLGKLKTKAFKIDGTSLPVLSLGDLIAMKRACGRPQDLEDVRALEELRA